MNNKTFFKFLQIDDFWWILKHFSANKFVWIVMGTRSEEVGE